MTKYLLIAILFLTACSDRNKTQFIKSDFFEVVKIDYHENWLQRIFVVISPDKVNDTTIIRQTICVLKESYPLYDKSNISFFSDKKYANYKTELFMDGKELLPPTEYRNWMNEYYLGEYEFETNEYKTFPISSKTESQKIYKINGCS